MRPLLTSLVAMVIFIASGAYTYANPRHATKLSANREPGNADALDHLRRGNRAFELKEYDTAITEYKEGAILDPVPLFWLDIGLAHRKAERYAQAIDYCQDFLDRSATDEDPEGIRDQIAQLIPQLEKARDAPPTHPAPSTSTTVSTTAAMSPTTAAPIGVPANENGAPAASTHAQVTSAPHHDRLAWGLTAGGLLLVGGGGALLLDASSTDKDAGREPNEARREQLYSQADTHRELGWAAIGVGAAAALYGTYRLLSSDPSTPHEPVARVLLGPGSFIVVGRF